MHPVIGGLVASTLCITSCLTGYLLDHARVTQGNSTGMHWNVCHSMGCEMKCEWYLPDFFTCVTAPESWQCGTFIRSP